jgi:5-methyltetrahydrofolate--homocysteine methyltransferase
MARSYGDLIEKRVPIIFDGALGTEVQKESLPVAAFAGHDGCNEILNLTRPDVIRGIHRSYFDAGADVVTTNTFGGNRPKLAEKGLEEKRYAINMAGVQLARQEAESAGKAGRLCLVAGSMGPTGSLPSSRDPSLNLLTFDVLADIYEEQAAALLDGGADLLLLETSQDLLEIRAAMHGIRRLFSRRGTRVPLHVQCTMDVTGRMLLGSDIGAYLGAVAFGADAVGMNCGTGPAEMAPQIERLLASTDLPIVMMPNAGMPVNIDGRAVYALTPAEFAASVVPLVVEQGVPMVGGCCGTTPDHIRELKRSLAGKRVAERRSNKSSCFCATGIAGVDLERLLRPIIIGERCNAQGSKRTKELILARNWDELYRLAEDQVGRGASLLDLCVAINERDDEVETMQELVSWLADRVGAPFCIDSTDAAVLEVALRMSPGSVMLNSINLEKGGERARRVLRSAVDFGCPVIALTIDDQGMAKTLERKIELAARLRDLACTEFGLPGHYLYIDPLVLTLATGNPQDADAAAVSLEAVRRIKAELGVRTVMGVSNVSYGLSPAARRILNTLMLHHAVEAGLDAAIFNPLHRDDISACDPEARRLGEALLFNRSADALQRFIRYFEVSAPADRVKVRREPIETLTPAETLRQAILLRDRRYVAKSVETLLADHSAAEILETIMLPAMDEVGKRMAAGTMILPFVLQAAEVMREALTLLEPLLKNDITRSKGKVILATVFGDVHDIGKNLVGSIMRNQGFEVIDLGKQVALETIVKAVADFRPDAVGLSALLVTTSREMIACVREFARLGLAVPVLIGGAAVSGAFAARIAQLEDGTSYKGGVYFCRDAFEASRIIERTRGGEVPKMHEAVPPDQTKAAGAPESMPAFEPDECAEPPFYGTGAVLRWDTLPLLEKIVPSRLFKAWWGGGRLGEQVYAEAEKKDFKPAFEKLRDLIAGSSLLDPAALYGFFPVITDAERVILLDPNDFHTEMAAFTFPRMPRSGNRSLADYLRPEGDFLALQAVTIGPGLSKRVGELFGEENRYSMGYFLNGLGSYLTEELAERVTGEILRLLGLPPGRGRRYSFGYPGMPPLDDQKKLFEIMAIEERLGITLTERFQMVPEHSTVGIFIRHHDAKYLV